jgi:hypothetical protein
MFQGMTNLTSVPVLSHFVADDVESVRYMFKDTNISDFSVINNWDINNVVGPSNDVATSNGFYHMCNETPSNAHPTFTQRNGSWDNEGTFLATAGPQGLVANLLAMGSDMPNAYGYDVNYSVTVNNTVKGAAVSTVLDDWKLLYCDGEYAYIITSGFASNNIVVGETPRFNLDAGQDACGEYGDCGDGNTLYVDGSKVAEANNYDYSTSLLPIYNTLNNNSYWTQLLTNQADLAWGSIPLDKLKGSWNEKYPSQQLADSNFTGNGGTEWSSGPGLDTLYFPTTEPSYTYVIGKTNTNMFTLYSENENIYGHQYYPYTKLTYGYNNQLRPVVRLKADVNGTIDTTNHTITLS